ncbi:MAG: hypothetical protein FRX48_02156 [Lasallia pustulata]|uniref:Calponin-homology (CH) domain-containing protein n=1 Tax=Lasallia pustulata TaxID=136370 RepID=A0A5M8PVX2_9LECA|nr:MAG: hypothetical protein FRX48_02156 [Lasallia pustulata]
MASVSSLDKDMRNLRLGKYTPQAANEVREWIEEVLGERILAGDLLEALKDGSVLCKLVNLAIGPPGVRYKASSMPFVQMENISHFLRACQSPPLSLPPHDVFLTVDLYESKDPAQVLQCLGAFSRKAHSLQPNMFSRAIGAKSRGGIVSPQITGTSSGGFNRGRGVSNASQSSSGSFKPMSQNNEGRASPTKMFGSNNSTLTRGDGVTSPSGGVSSWSKRTDEAATTPAWNIHQYGYMGGASQGNQGITFGGRRQITTPAPKVPNLAEKERRRREEEAEAERLRIQAEEAEHKRRVEREAEEERERIAEEQRWEEETRKQREVERKAAEEEKRRWEEEERRWKEEEETRIREEREAEARLEKERQRKRANSDARLKGQFLSQYQAEQRQLLKSPSGDNPERSAERERVKELERELEKAKERERQYERERQERLQQTHHHVLETHDLNTHHKASAQHDRSQTRTPSAGPAPYPSHHHHNPEAWRATERDYLRREWAHHHPNSQFGTTPPRPPPPNQTQKPTQPPLCTNPRPLPTPASPPQHPRSSPATPKHPLPAPPRPQNLHHHHAKPFPRPYPEPHLLPHPHPQH